MCAKEHLGTLARDIGLAFEPAIDFDRFRCSPIGFWSSCVLLLFQLRYLGFMLVYVSSC